jgi:hypothetical protein
MTDAYNAALIWAKRRGLPTTAELLAIPGIKAVIEKASRISCEWQGQRFEARSAHGASNALCRQLVAAGCPDQALHVFHSAGAYRFTQRSIHEAAKWTYGDGASEMLHIRRYNESPFAAGAVAPKMAVELRGYWWRGPSQRPTLALPATLAKRHDRRRGRIGARLGYLGTT